MKFPYQKLFLEKNKKLLTLNISMEDIEIPRVRKRDLIPIVGLFTYNEMVYNLQEKANFRLWNYQEVFNVHAGIRASLLVAYNTVALAIYLPLTIKGLESLF